LPTQRDFSRRGERGFTLLEALLVVVITALVATMLFSFLGRSTARTWERADEAIDVVEAANAEVELRSLLLASATTVGGGAQFEARSSVGQSTRCLSMGGERLVRVLIRGRTLQCDSGGRRRTLLSWRRGEARFTYSGDGRTWRETWSTGTPALVRFELRQDARIVLEWVSLGGGRASNEREPPA
jgi:type II secretory pathway pseudopilin PulG